MLGERKPVRLSLTGSYMYIIYFFQVEERKKCRTTNDDGPKVDNATRQTVVLPWEVSGRVV